MFAPLRHASIPGHENYNFNVPCSCDSCFLAPETRLNLSLKKLQWFWFCSPQERGRIQGEHKLVQHAHVLLLEEL